MARPREFDPDAVLDSALQVFWTKGYELSSLDDICAAAGICRSSIYASFGDKRELLLRALARYGENGAARMATMLAARQTIREGVADLLRGFVDGIVSGPGRRGCFIGNCAIELAQHDRVAMRRVMESLRHIEAVLLVALERAKTRGELAANTDTTALSRYFMSGFQGLRLVGKVNPDRKTLEDIAATMLRVLD